jgi:cytochrome P450 family 6
MFGFAESLRKHPPVAKIDRACTQPYIIPGTNIELEVGTSVSISIMGLHHDPKYYPQPEVFNPNRFTPAQKLTRSPYVFLPFGLGPRNCIGKNNFYL